MLCRFLWLIREIKMLTRDMSPMTTMKKEFKYMILKRCFYCKGDVAVMFFFSNPGVGSRGRVQQSLSTTI